MENNLTLTNLAPYKGTMYLEVVSSWEEPGWLRKKGIRKERWSDSAKAGTWNLPTEPAQVPDFSFPSILSPGILEATKKHPYSHPTADCYRQSLPEHICLVEREPVQE